MNKKGINIVIYILAAVGLVAILGAIVYFCISMLGVKPSDASSKANDAIEETEDSVNKAIEDYASDEDGEAKVSKADLATPTPSPTAKKTNGNLKLDDSLPTIVFFGDSVYNYHRGDGTSIPELIAKRCNTNCINLSVDEMCAAIPREADREDMKNYSDSGIGLVSAIAGTMDVDILSDSDAKRIIEKNIDVIKEADVFVFEYGIYDYMNDNRLDNTEMYEDPAAYMGAMQKIVRRMQEINPYAKMLFMKPHYCEIYDENGTYLGSNQDYHKLYGTLFDYAGRLDNLVNNQTIFTYQTDGENEINMYTVDKCLEKDGINLTKQGREVYSDVVGGFICRNILGTEAPRE